MSDADHLEALDWLHQRLTGEGIEYWLFGGWAVDFHVGAITRLHADLDLAVWAGDLDRIGTLLRADGWTHSPEDSEPGSTAFTRGSVRAELAFLQRDGASGEPYTPLGDGDRATWAPAAFGRDIRALAGVHARVIALPALRVEKSYARDDSVADVKDRQDLEALRRLD